MNKKYGFRAGCGQSFDHGDWESWVNVSENGRQFRSPVTGQINDLSGANYWEMRKELPDKLSSAESVRWDSYTTPSYYHLKKEQIEPSECVDKGDVIVQDEPVDKESVMMSLSDDNIFKVLYLKFFGGK